MNKDDVIKLEIDNQYSYCYPYGYDGDVQLEVLKGKYKGLVLDILDSAIINITKENGEKDDRFNFKYKILKMWNKVDKNQFDGKKITLNEDDQIYINSMIYNFIFEFLKNDENKRLGLKFIDGFKKKINKKNNKDEK